MLPAVGQGALVVQTRSNDDPTIAIVSNLDHEPTRVACLAERAFLRALGGGCQLPIAGYAVMAHEELTLEGLVADREGQETIRGKLKGPSSSADKLGTELAMQLLQRGAGRLLAQQ
jgi:hydroxymethylbilane synthase